MRANREMPSNEGGWSVRRALAASIRTVLAYQVTLGFCAVYVAMTLIVKAWIGSAGDSSDVLRTVGYGLPAFLDYRPWTILAGLPVGAGLDLIPPYLSIVGIAVYEHRAGHLRALGVFVGAHVVAVLAVALALWPIRQLGNGWLHAIGHVLDVGSSNGAYACLGAWSATLSAPARRRWQAGISAYLIPMLLFQGLIYDITHPVGWVCGLAAGRFLAAGTNHPFDPRKLVAREWPWLLAAVLVGAALGVHDAWGGGNGGPFGWGPGTIGH